MDARFLLNCLLNEYYHSLVQTFPYIVFNGSTIFCASKSILFFSTFVRAYQGFEFISLNTIGVTAPYTLNHVVLVGGGGVEKPTSHQWERHQEFIHFQLVYKPGGHMLTEKLIDLFR